MYDIVNYLHFVFYSAFSKFSLFLFLAIGYALVVVAVLLKIIQILDCNREFRLQQYTIQSMVYIPVVYIKSGP